MKRSFIRDCALLVPVALALSACDSNTTAPTTPTTPTVTPVSITETFDGTLTSGSSNVTTFQAGLGQVTATLNTVGPLATIGIGVGLGMWDGNSCLVQTSNDDIKAAGSVVGTVTLATTLCLKVYDSGNVTDTTTYDISVVHY